MKYNMLASEIRVLGRTVQGEAVPVFWTGSGLETIFEGRDLYLEYVSNYAVYEDWIPGGCELSCPDYQRSTAHGR